ncbi:MAG: class I SAM-dependent methyltransferase [Candidatus Marinimicrobia bacterium]|jgi:SAM-dependent methyltransferase|nr:class I SAM-dependent methyltransferase [Candidatus Neomarinimicrobiota bacterium]
MNKYNSKVVGLDVGLLIGKFFMETEDLHYGYWPHDKTATAQNFAEAQQRHSQLIIDHIPEGVENILDVGSGSGNLAKKLISLGYHVDCVIPSEFLAERVKEKLDENSTIHICKFEAVETNLTYDLILFSESFQYIPMDKSIPKIQKLLSPNGNLLICDVFHKNVPGKSPMRGGHRWDYFEKIIEDSNLKLTCELDITEETAPTYDFLNQLLTDVAEPISEMTGGYLNYKYPKLTKLIKWKFQKKLNRINHVWFSGKLTGENFIKFKSYKLLIYKA